jgi:Tol biopolymer transport system component
MRTIILILISFCFLQCQSQKNANMDQKETGMPAWLQEKIDEYAARPVENPPIEIHEYEYDGQTTFYITAPCCDQFTALYDKNGKVICAPDGGITGKGDGKCPDFREKAKHVKLVWKDSRDFGK